MRPSLLTSSLPCHRPTAAPAPIFSSFHLSQPIYNNYHNLSPPPAACHFQTQSSTPSVSHFTAAPFVASTRSCRNSQAGPVLKPLSIIIKMPRWQISSQRRNQIPYRLRHHQPYHFRNIIIILPQNNSMRAPNISFNILMVVGKMAGGQAAW